MKTSNESVSKISKKEIQKQLRGVLMKAVGRLGIRIPSKKLKKEIKETSKNIGELVVHNILRSHKETKVKSKAYKEKDKEI